MYAIKSPSIFVFVFHDKQSVFLPNYGCFLTRFFMLILLTRDLVFAQSALAFPRATSAILWSSEFMAILKIFQISAWL